LAGPSGLLNDLPITLNTDILQFYPFFQTIINCIEFYFVIWNMPFYQLINDNFKEIHGACIALLGGGGKTALLHKLAEELSQKFSAVLETSVTNTAYNEQDNPLIFKDIEQVKGTSQNPLFVVGEKISECKLRGITVDDLYQIRDYFNVSIFECDGARNQPLKAHTDYDPIVPNFTTHVIIIVGAEVVNTKIGDGLVHRPELFCKKWSVDLDTIVDIDFIVRVVSTQQGYLDKIRHDAHISYFINKIDTHPEEAISLVKALKNTIKKPVFYGSVQNNLFMAS
jgi:probable selenium-dependent hydroxylase accessory protein YqeC